MPRFKKAVFFLAVAGAMWLVAMPARAQDNDNAPPTYKAKPLHTQGDKPIRGRFEVLHMMPTGIQVRSLSNKLEIHTFTYSDQIHARMMQIINEGGYKYGDKVEIVYAPGAQVALKIEGKFSKLN